MDTYRNVKMKYLKRFLRNKAVSTLWDKGIAIDKASHRSDIDSFIRMIRPVRCPFPLIRVGGTEDGSYIVPDDIKDLSATISPGVSLEIDFDLEMAGRGCPVVMVDYSVQGPPVDHSNFYFYKKHLDVYDSDNTTRLDTLVSSVDVCSVGDLLLQMDIEGAEYRVLLDSSDQLLERFRVIVVELHSIGRVFSCSGADLLLSLAAHLTHTHYVVHVAPNNRGGLVRHNDIEIPWVVELTLLRKDRFSEVPEFSRGPYPHPLDVDNDSSIPSVHLPKSWYEK